MSHPIEEKNNSKNSTFTLSTIEIRKNVSLDIIVTEQQIIPITYREIQFMVKDTIWKHSLEELLEALN